MGVFNPTHVKVGPGTLYAAPLGTTEPTGVTGAWPAGWVTLGYTDQGSDFDFTPSSAKVEVEETGWPVKNVIDAYEAKLTFAMAETTRQNLILALNGSIGTAQNTKMVGKTTTTGAVWAEPPKYGTELRVMLGWDSLIEGATSGNDPFGRLIARKCLQTGGIKITRRKGNNKATYSVEFSLEKPNGTEPFRMYFEPNMAS